MQNNDYWLEPQGGSEPALLSRDHRKRD